ncbi:MAG: helicase-related protein, partial [Synergistota bacterium]|nr:helicase-related protein [Synergistota bacterium]
VTTALLTGSMPPSEREPVLAGVRDGSVSLLVGTHALIQEKVEFRDLAAVVADEQHRFGVMQRNMLVSKGTLPHVLVMTATPIPRTLSLSVYGDLSVSVIDELPPGRIPVVTRAMKKPTRRFLDFLRSEMDAGRQAYWVCPLIEDSEKSDLASAVARFESLRSMFGAERVGLLHGRLSGSEKESVMTSFAGGDIRLLVATTVIEVGIDVQDATVMVIENAHRFGLSQLHQLRGRVGRNGMKGYCVLLGHPGSPEGRSRLRVMTSTNDGFKVAEADLAMRGPGEVCGVRQHGVTDFLVADLRRDRRLLEEARKTAFDLVERDPLLKSCPGLLGEVLRRFGDRLSLAETA